MSVSFDVDDVAPAREALPQTTSAAALDRIRARERTRWYGDSTLLAQAGPESVVDKARPWRDLIDRVTRRAGAT